MGRFDPLLILGLFPLVALLNLLLMVRPPRRGGRESAVYLIPARDEAENLARLVPELVAQGARVVVFDDESVDETALVAGRSGATVVRPDGPLPPGWTGKNRACHALGTMEHGSDWIVFLDADTYVGPEFVERFEGLMARAGRYGVVTGIPRVLPGRGVEPLFMAWIGWIILATNPFGLVARTGMGHNYFLNGQVGAWRTSLYQRLRPNERVRGRVMEDVETGRLLARERVPVLVANLSPILSVRMYREWRETLDGFSKNAYEITGNTVGTFALALGLLALAIWPWAWVPIGVSSLLVALTARAPVWPALLPPVWLGIGAFTLVRSWWWHRTGQVRWKGRVYSGREKTEA